MPFRITSQSLSACNMHAVEIWRVSQESRMLILQISWGHEHFQFRMQKLPVEICKEMDLTRPSCSSEACIAGYRGVNCRDRASPRVPALVRRYRSRPSLTCKASAYVYFKLFLIINHLVCKAGRDAFVEQLVSNSVKFTLQRPKRRSRGRSEKNDAQSTRSSSCYRPDIKIDHAWRRHWERWISISWIL